MIATYRLQLSPQFTLHDARARVPYLAALGVSHLYCSPVLAARPGSTHGYDVTDPTHVSEALGGDAAFAALAETAHEHGMGIVLDIVPNHMGIGPANPYWDDVLTHGARSRYADWFDVDWRAPAKRLAGKVLLPVLGDSLDAVIDRDEISLDVTDLGVRVRYFDHHFPVDPATLPPELEVALLDPMARTAIAGWGRGAEGHARLRALLAAQHYVLAFWRTAQRDLNYRRFFDVNELICLRVEREPVFEATHRTVLQLVADGLVDGLRIDHVDGLLEPRRYLERLRAAVDARRPAADASARFPIVVEKILAAGETLPPEWPVDGTTGYELMVAIDDALIDPDGYERLEARYRGRAGADFHAVALDAKRRVLRAALNADVRRIAPMLAQVARASSVEKLSIAACAGAIVELTTVLPVYRTYLDAEHPDASARDRAVLEDSFARVRERGLADALAVAALERVLLGPWHDANADLSRARMAFVLRWQQLTGPAAAKGVEDTALYSYAPLASRNEVGGDPGVPIAGAVARLHARLAERAARYPRSLNATNTHDTKRSADVRSRLDALSEHDAAWTRKLRDWRRLNRSLRTLAGGRLAPTRTTDNFIYQALVGVWPMDEALARRGDPDVQARLLAELRERLTAYVRKAVREAKVSTSWTDPDERYEAAVAHFVDGLLDRDRSAEFLRGLEQFVAELTPHGVWNALSRVVLHLMAPGVPDLYQGDELWFQALVDPDNRRPVDWEARDAMMRSLWTSASSGGLSALLREPGDGRLKFALTRQLLFIRRDHVAIMARGSHIPLDAMGTHGDRVIAFERSAAGDSLLVVVPRLTRALGADAPLGDTWGDTMIRASSANWRCLLTGAERVARDGALPLRELFSELPVAVLRAVPRRG